MKEFLDLLFARMTQLWYCRGCFEIAEFISLCQFDRISKIVVSQQDDGDDNGIKLIYCMGIDS